MAYFILLREVDFFDKGQWLYCDDNFCQKVEKTVSPRGVVTISPPYGLEMERYKLEPHLQRIKSTSRKKA